MNLVLLHPRDFVAADQVRLDGRRAEHIRVVLGAQLGQEISVGLRDGALGRGVVRALQPAAVELEVKLDREPPPRAGVDVVLALPRPKILRKVLQAVASCGVGHLALVGSYRVEKSYFHSPALGLEAIAEELDLGLEQARDTRPPTVSVHRHFKPFIEDALPQLFPKGIRLLADPHAASTLPATPSPEPFVLAIGPEGGWTPYEAEQLEARGFAPFTLGPRILRVDVAVPYLLGQLATRRLLPTE